MEKYSPGMRLIIRDEEWLVKKADNNSIAGQTLSVIGLSRLVKDKESIFITDLEDIEAIDPKNTKLIPDTSSNFIKSRLHMESLLRRKSPTDNKLHIGHKAAMNLLDYQLDPAILALEKPRQRILIADAVGLGKTLEAGILMSELIYRGKGKRILVLTVKSMMTQFQKEMWNRFSINLERLDSHGIQRIRSTIPSNYNPFYYYDKVIISIDTLKQQSEYRNYLENAWWDIIVIDEAHNVAQRGGNNQSSQRARLAKLLSERSDTLIMLSATPHDGRAESFASLMNMLDPTAIANPSNYSKKDINGLFIRRFKKDIQNQVEGSFKERKIYKEKQVASYKEEQVFDYFTSIEFKTIDGGKKGGELFKTTLEKSLFSSHKACIKTIENRIKTLSKKLSNPRLVPVYAEVSVDIDNEEHQFINIKSNTSREQVYHKENKTSQKVFDRSIFEEEEKSNDYDTYVQHDIKVLSELKEKLESIVPTEFSRYKKLIELLKSKDYNWDMKNTKDRVVIFTERIETLKFLKENLVKDLKLKENNIVVMHGQMSDIEQQMIVDDFGKEKSPLRILIASDVASEGINLHYLSHRLIHFDIPWSLMVFQQRNGRIDRYGQEKTPDIRYLITESNNKKIKGDVRILEVLIKKEDEAVRNIGDPSLLMNKYDEEEENRFTAQAIENNIKAEEFENSLFSNISSSFNPLELMLSNMDNEENNKNKESKDELITLFSDYNYLKRALDYFNCSENIEFETLQKTEGLKLTIDKELEKRLQRLMPMESIPKNKKLQLSTDKELIQEKIKESRQLEKTWPEIQYLWPMHPIIQWVNDKSSTIFERQEAPVIGLVNVLPKDEVIFIISGLIPNRKSQPSINDWFGVVFNDNKVKEVIPLQEVLKRTKLKDRDYPNINKITKEHCDKISLLLPKAIQSAVLRMENKLNEFDRENKPKLDEHLKELQKLKDKHIEQLTFEEKNNITKGRKIIEKQNSIDKTFNNFEKWIKDTMILENNPYIQVISVLVGVE